MTKKTETSTASSKKKTSKKQEIDKIEKPKKSAEELKKTRLESIKIRNKNLIKINENKENEVNSKKSKYYAILNKHKDLIKANLKKNSRSKIKKIIGVKQVEKGVTPLLCAVGFEMLDKLCTELYINFKYSKRKMVTSDIIAFTIKNMKF